MITEGTGFAPLVYSYTRGGYTLSSHLLDLKTEGNALRNFVFGTQSEYQWDFIIMQEQSERNLEPPGDFNIKAEETRHSLEDIMTIVFGQAEKKEPLILLYQTWGRRDDYWEGQDNLVENFNLHLDHFREIDYFKLNITRCGEAWRLLYIDSAVHGNPLTPPNSFFDLYAGDGSHPTYKGSFLNALVMYKSITGLDPRDLTFKPTQLTNCVIGYLKNASVGEMVDTVPCLPSTTSQTTSSSSTTSFSTSQTTSSSSTTSSSESSTTSSSESTIITSSEVFTSSPTSYERTETSLDVTSSPSATNPETSVQQTVPATEQPSTQESANEIIDETTINPQIYLIIGIVAGFTVISVIIVVVICVLKKNQTSKIIQPFELDNIVNF